MTNAYEDLLSHYANLFSIMNGHMLQSANEHKEIRVRPAFSNVVSNQHQEKCVKPISWQL